jgi:glycosyltransferase involved in cell wall biosynthesis
MDRRRGEKVKKERSLKPAAPPFPQSILIMVPYESDIGFAIVRLMKAFFEMGTMLTGSISGVHFSFTRLHPEPSPAFPRDYANLLEFNVVEPDLESVKSLQRYVRKRGIQQVMGLDLPVGAACCRALRAVGVGSIVAYWGAPMSSIRGLPKLLLKRIECRIRRRSSPSWYIFESEAMRRTAVYGRGVPRARTSIVRTGVDVEEFKPSNNLSSVVHDRFSIPFSRKIVVYMGHLHERKGVHVLIRAMSVLRHELAHNDLQLLILGNRQEEIGPFADLAQGSGVSDHVTFGGYQNDVAALLSACDIGCIPSTGWDSFPMSSLEMQACGLPLVVSDLQGVPETVRPDETAFVVPAGDARATAVALLRLADDEGLRSRMGAEAVRWICENLTRRHQVERLTDAMREAFRYER